MVLAQSEFLRFNNEFLTMTYDYIENHEKFGDKVPSIEGLAIMLGVSKRSIYIWENDPDTVEFSEALESLRAKIIKLYEDE